MGTVYNTGEECSARANKNAFDSWWKGEGGEWFGLGDNVKGESHC